MTKWEERYRRLRSLIGEATIEGRLAKSVLAQAIGDSEKIRKMLAHDTAYKLARELVDKMGVVRVSEAPDTVVEKDIRVIACAMVLRNWGELNALDQEAKALEQAGEDE